MKINIVAVESTIPKKNVHPQSTLPFSRINALVLIVMLMMIRAALLHALQDPTMPSPFVLHLENSTHKLFNLYVSL
jgi:hypothetical protein